MAAERVAGGRDASRAWTPATTRRRAGASHSAADRLRGGTCCVTYADGVADIDLAALLAGTRRRRPRGDDDRRAPRAAVRRRRARGGRPRSPGFREKPRSEHWVNGGFLCLEPAALDVHRARTTCSSRARCRALAAAGQLRAHRHEGFWDCMDTYKDAVLLNDLCERGEAPWRRW